MAIVASKMLLAVFGLVVFEGRDVKFTLWEKVPKA